MQPVYPYIQVEKVKEEEGVLSYTINEKPIVQVKILPNDADEISRIGIKIGDKILVNQVDEYPLNNNMLYFVKIKDIVCIMK